MATGRRKGREEDGEMGRVAGAVHEARREGKSIERRAPIGQVGAKRIRGSRERLKREQQEAEEEDMRVG